LVPPLSQQPKDVFTTLPLFCLGNRAAHQLGNNGAFVLSAEDAVELRLDVVWDAEIYCSHPRAFAIVESCNNNMRLDCAVVNAPS
jgi:hypothetical protein